MTRFFSSSNLIAYLFFLILITLIWMPNIIIGYQESSYYVFHEDNFNNWLESWGNGNIQLIAFFLILILAAGFNIIYNQTDIVRSNTIIPAMLIFIIHGLHPFSPDYLRLLFAELLLLICLARIMKIERQLKTNSIAIDSGILFGLIFWLIPILGVGIFFVLIAISVLKAIHWREVFWAVSGFIIPGVFVTSAQYLLDLPITWIPPSLIPLSEIAEPDNLKVFDMAFYICFALLGLFSFWLLLSSYTRKTIRIKNLTKIFILFLVFQSAVLITSYFMGNMEYGFVLLAIPLSTILYSLLASDRYQLVSKALFFISIITVLTHNWLLLLN